MTFLMIGVIPPIPVTPNTEETAERHKQRRIKGNSTPEQIAPRTVSAVDITPDMTAAEVTFPPAIISAVIVGVTADIKVESVSMKDSANEKAVSVTEKTAVQIQSMPTSSSAVFIPESVTVSRSARKQAAMIRSPRRTAKFLLASGAAEAISFKKVSEK